MDPFFDFLPRGPPPAPSPPNPKRKIQLVLNGNEENPREDNFDPALILKAMNNTFIGRMSDRLEEVDLVSCIQDFVFNSGKVYKNSPQDIARRKWCIVALDERPLQHAGIGKLNPMQSMIACCGSGKSNTNQFSIVKSESQLPISLKLYSLTLNMNESQLHFQSLSKPENRFFINLDTVRVQFSDSDPSNQIAPIFLKVIDQSFPLEVHIYITSATIPFPLSDSQLDKQKLYYLQNSRSSLSNLLQEAVKKSRGQQFQLETVRKRCLQFQINLFAERFATEEQFSMFCETGDILLFRDNHTMAKVQRALTNSEYDHVAIVYKSQQLGICVFQSNSGTGVALASWRHLIRFHWFQGIQKIAWRKLQLHEKPVDFHEKVTEFVKGNLHKKFGLNLNKLLRFKSVAYTHDAKKTYFCSQLVSTLYKYLGILKQTKSSTQYWPKDFADGNGLQILNGALDPERELVFEHSLLKESYKFYQQKI